MVLTCSDRASLSSLLAPTAATYLHPRDQMIDNDGYNWAPFSTPERHAIYAYLNTWIQHHGLDAFVCKPWTESELIFLTHTINNLNAANENPNIDTATAAPRSVMGVRRQIHHLGQGRLSPLAKLGRRAEALKRDVEAGRVVENGERFPDMTILVPRVVDGVYMISAGPVVQGLGRVDVAASEFEEDTPIVCDGNINDDGYKRVWEGVEREIEENEAPAAKKQKKMVVKLSVDCSRLHVRKDETMVVLEEGEIWEGSSSEEQF